MQSIQKIKSEPSIVFIDSRFPLTFSLVYSKSIIICEKRLKKYTSDYVNKGKLFLFLPGFIIKILIYILVNLKINICISAGFYRYCNSFKYVNTIPDGLYSEILQKKIPGLMHRLIPLNDCIANIISNTYYADIKSEEKIIIGANWVGNNNMSRENYINYLKWLRINFPDHKYFLHPLEESGIAGKYIQTIENKGLYDDYIRIYGAPVSVVSSGSTSTLVTALHPFARNFTKLILISNISYFCDGPAGDLIFSPYILKKFNLAISVDEYYIHLKDNLDQISFDYNIKRIN